MSGGGGAVRRVGAMRGIEDLGRASFPVGRGRNRVRGAKAFASNTAGRLEGPARFGKDVDLDSPAMWAFYAELVVDRTIVDPMLVVRKPLLMSDGSAVSPEFAPFAGVVPPTVARGWRVGGYPLLAGLTRDDYRRSFAKLVALVGRMHRAGVPIVAGTDGTGLELVRELELYRRAGLTNAEALQSAIFVPARMTAWTTASARSRRAGRRTSSWSTETGRGPLGTCATSRPCSWTATAWKAGRCGRRGFCPACSIEIVGTRIADRRSGHAYPAQEEIV